MLNEVLFFIIELKSVIPDAGFPEIISLQQSVEFVTDSSPDS
jgi:hypothetical protein